MTTEKITVKRTGWVCLVICPACGDGYYEVTEDGLDEEIECGECGQIFEVVD